MTSRKADLDNLLDRCLAAFVEAGTLDLSLDHLAKKAGRSKRMLVHYFGGRENIEEGAMTRLEERLRAQFAPDSFSRGESAKAVVTALWDRATVLESRGVLLLVLDLSRRAWSGSERAKTFYAEQQRLWVEQLLRFLPDQAAVKEVLQLFQGAIVEYLITGDRESGRRTLMRTLARQHKTPRRPISRKKNRNAKPV
jgi:AcrR family transcriptional regulator